MWSECLTFARLWIDARANGVELWYQSVRVLCVPRMLVGSLRVLLSSPIPCRHGHLIGLNSAPLVTSESHPWLVPCLWSVYSLFFLFTARLPNWWSSSSFAADICGLDFRGFPPCVWCSCYLLSSSQHKIMATSPMKDCFSRLCLPETELRRHVWASERYVMCNWVLVCSG